MNVGLLLAGGGDTLPLYAVIKLFVLTLKPGLEVPSHPSHPFAPFFCTSLYPSHPFVPFTSLHILSTPLHPSYLLISLWSKILGPWWGPRNAICHSVNVHGVVFSQVVGTQKSSLELSLQPLHPFVPFYILCTLHISSHTFTPFAPSH